MAKYVDPYSHSYLELNFVTEEDRTELFELYDKWQHYREFKDFKQADVYRILYGEWNTTLKPPDTWVPIFESINHRKKRFLRNDEILKSGIVITKISLLNKEQIKSADFYNLPHC